MSVLVFFFKIKAFFNVRLNILVTAILLFKKKKWYAPANHKLGPTLKYTLKYCLFYFKWDRILLKKHHVVLNKT